jgi:hypothetical protein
MFGPDFDKRFPPMRLLLAALPFFASPPLAAQDLTQAEAGFLPRIIDSLCVDLVETSTGCEQVFLLSNPDEPDTADLVILTDRRTDPGGRPLLVLRSAFFNGAMWGMSPSLEAADNGQLYIRSEQIGIGRNPWTQTITLAWDTSRFVMTAFEHSVYDRALGGSYACSVDYRAGSAIAEILDAESNPLENFAETVPAILPAISDISAFEALPEFCETTIQRYFEIVN